MVVAPPTPLEGTEESRLVNSTFFHRTWIGTVFLVRVKSHRRVAGGAMDSAKHPMCQNTQKPLLLPED